MKSQDPPIYRASYELSLAILRYAQDLPEKYQKSFALILENKLIEMQDLIYRINESENKSEAIYQVLGKAYFIRMAIRLFLDLRIMKTETNMIFNLKIEDLISQLSSWRKSLKEL
ncbi:MAG: hypothetical protein PF488_04045 [Patescibacteria group bacterium]|jgi:hypothetical protein|nr:hypothetical protein [Patescibacteria group bacterium]